VVRVLRRDPGLSGGERTRGHDDDQGTHADADADAHTDARLADAPTHRVHPDPDSDPDPTDRASQEPADQAVDAGQSAADHPSLPTADRLINAIGALHADRLGIDRQQHRIIEPVGVGQRIAVN
jgi:hypothetical protein